MVKGMHLGRKSIAALWIGLVYSVSAWGIGLGPMTVDSSLNQRLTATVELLSADGLDLSYYQARIASDEQFEALGLDKAPELKQISFTVTRDPKGHAVITLRSAKVIKDPFLSLVVELSWPKGHISREYTLLLDPPTLSVAPSVAKTSKASRPRIEVDDTELEQALTSFNQPILDRGVAADTNAGLKLGVVQSTGNDFDELKQRLKSTEDTLDVLRRTNELLLERQQELAQQNKDLLTLLQKNLTPAQGAVEVPTAVTDVVPSSSVSDTSSLTAPAPTASVPDEGEVTAETSATPVSEQVTALPDLPVTATVPDVSGEATPVESAPVVQDDGHPWVWWTIICVVFWAVYRIRLKMNPPVSTVFEEAKLMPLVSEDDDLPFDTRYPPLSIKQGRNEPVVAAAVQEVDTIAAELDNVDIFLSYEKYPEAEKVLQALYDKAPTRNDIKLRLASLYAGLNNEALFEKYFQECATGLLKEPNPAISERLTRLKDGFKKSSSNLKEKLQQEFKDKPVATEKAPRAGSETLPPESAPETLHFETPALVSTVALSDKPPEDESTAGHIEFEVVSFETTEEVKDSMEFDQTNTIQFVKPSK